MNPSSYAIIFLTISIALIIYGIIGLKTKGVFVPWNLFLRPPHHYYRYREQIYTENESILAGWTYIFVGSIFPVSYATIILQATLNIDWLLFVTIPALALIGVSIMFYNFNRAKGNKIKFITVLFLVCLPILILVAAFANEKYAIFPKVPTLIILVSTPLLIAFGHFMYKKRKQQKIS